MKKTVNMGLAVLAAFLVVGWATSASAQVESGSHWITGFVGGQLFDLNDQFDDFGTNFDKEVNFGVHYPYESLLERSASLSEAMRRLPAWPELEGGSERVVSERAPANSNPVTTMTMASASSTQADSAGPGTPRELLPDLGQIGAQVGLLLGASDNPFEADTGFLAGAIIDLPLFNVPGGKISYEILISNQIATTDVRITSPLSAIGDLLAADGLGDTLTSRVLSSLKDLPAEEDLDVMTVAPFGLKYTITTLDHKRIRPYVVGSWGIYVTITDQDPKLTIDPRLEGAFIGGIAPEAIELSARGVPEGQGDKRFGGNGGGGVEFRVVDRASIGVEYRYHKVEGTNGGFSTFVGKLGFHF